MKKVILGIVVTIVALVLLVVIAANPLDNRFSDNSKPSPKVAICPLDGAEVKSLEGRLFAVAIDNGPKASPQNGLQEADLVYELPVEGGITRFLAFFYHAKPEKIGPVRSARPYVIYLAKGYNSVYTHCGQSPEAQEYFSSGDVEHINEMAYSNGFWRDKDRRPPVNLYTSYDKLMSIITEHGTVHQTDVPSFNFYDNKVVDSMSVGTAKKISIPYVYRKVSYVYDMESNKYLRNMDGKSHIDKSTESQITADNVIIQTVNVKVLDDAGRLSVNIVGSGKGILFQHGQVKAISWSKASPNDPVIYTDSESGEAIKLIAGKTFVQVVPSEVKVAYGDIN